MLKLYYVGSHDVKLQVMMAAMFCMNKILSICYNSDSASRGINPSVIEEVHAYQRPRVIAPMEVAALSSFFVITWEGL